MHIGVAANERDQDVVVRYQINSRHDQVANHEVIIKSGNPTEPVK